MSSLSDAESAVVALCITLAGCFSMLILGIEGAVGGTVSNAVVMMPMVIAAAVVVWVGRGTARDDVEEASSEQPTATEL